MRIGIVNDSVMACEALRRVVLSAPGHTVAWIAKDGEQAVAMARSNRPDLILMDLFMPGTDGVQATRQIMAESPCAVLVVTATVSGHIGKVYQAMGFGALDAVDTPVLGSAGEVAGGSSLLRKIDLIGRLIGKAPSRIPDEFIPSAASHTGRFQKPALHPLVVIGSSTGGPFALAETLAGLPKVLRAGIVIVQHVDVAFAPGLGHWLSEESERNVTLISEGMEPSEGGTFLSGTDEHLVLGPDRRLHHSAEPRSISYRPSVDVFFSSVARHWPRPGVGVLLTGMGRDGAAGLLALRQTGWKTIAQDAETSVVWGMPKAAAELGAAEQVLPLPLIAQAIEGLLFQQNQSQAQTRPTPR
jgi:two-component system response regulator WspF